MTTIPNREVLPALRALNRLLDKPLPVSGALKIRKLHPVLTRAWEDIDSVRKSLIDQHGQKGPDGKLRTERVGDDEQPVFSEDGRTRFMQALDELLAFTVEVPVTLTPADFGTALDVEPLVLLELGGLLVLDD